MVEFKHDNSLGEQAERERERAREREREREREAQEHPQSTNKQKIPEYLKKTLSRDT